MFFFGFIHVYSILVRLSERDLGFIDNGVNEVLKFRTFSLKFKDDQSLEDVVERTNSFLLIILLLEKLLIEFQIPLEHFDNEIDIRGQYLL